jgi:hypothetical protein
MLTACMLSELTTGRTPEAAVGQNKTFFATMRRSVTGTWQI